jgi:hypothetical protein
MFIWSNVAIFWDVAQCSPYVNQRFGVTSHLHLQGTKLAEQETTKMFIWPNVAIFWDVAQCL